MSPLTLKYERKRLALLKAARQHPGITVQAYKDWLKMLTTPKAVKK